MDKNQLGDSVDYVTDLAQLARLALSEKSDDVRLFIARLVRKYRSSRPDLADELERYLHSKPARSNAILRKAASQFPAEQALPVDHESRMSLLREFRDKPDGTQPLLSEEVGETLRQLIQERQQADHLAALGLHPTRSAIFLGQPGVGKTLTARWLAAQLGVPLYVLDLTTVMSSLLGKTGINLRAALDFAKSTRCVLLLDEIDAIAKRRSDDSDVGELKRLVTVILQEVDEWPASGLLLAATNHPELIDPALWRRFDLVIEFGLPDSAQIKSALRRFLGPDYPSFERWADILAFAFAGESFSDIERVVQRFRRALALRISDAADLVEDFIKSRSLQLEGRQRIELAVMLASQTRLSQHTISELTGVSRDTIRKYTKEIASPIRKAAR